MITAEVALYPQKTESASQIINDSLGAIGRQNLRVDVGSVSTRLQGTEETVWEGLKTLFEKAGTRSEVSMVVTLSNSAE
ncbi:MAG: YkoF family thiamine/hydroxymethylpyrimidine-binding protein [Desulfocucumaceae bacterium]